jgi:uncharacterized protein (DUF302 family)
MRYHCGLKSGLKIWLVGITLLLQLMSGSVWAEHKKLIMGRSYEAFPEAMTALQGAIKEAGYTVSFVQRVDVGLTDSGYQTDKYRVVFFGKPEEMQALPEKYPALTPYLPLAITIFAEQQETILVAMSPAFIAQGYLSDEDSDLRDIFLRWEKDIAQIIETVSAVEQ